MSEQIDKLIEELRVPGSLSFVEDRLATLRTMYSIDSVKVTHGVFVGLLCYFSSNQKGGVLKLPESLNTYLTFAHKQSLQIATEKNPAGIDHLVVGYSHLMKLLATSNTNLKGVYGTRAKKSFFKAMQDKEVNSEAKLMDACMLWNTPLKHGGDKEKALKMLHELRDDPNLNKVAANIFDSYQKAKILNGDAVTQARNQTSNEGGKYSIRRLTRKKSRIFELNIENLQFPAGKLTALVGRNGAGKSTLLTSLLSVETPECLSLQYMSGKLHAEWIDKQIDTKNLGFQLTSIQNILNIKVAEIVKFHKLLYNNQDQSVFDSLGIENLLEKSVSDLSSGELKRTEIFFAMAHWPEIVVLDEPTAMVDQLYAREVYKLLKIAAHKQKCAIICATHDIDIITLADQISLVSRGKLVESFNRSSIFEKYGQSVMLKIVNSNNSDDRFNDDKPAMLITKENLLVQLRKFDTSAANSLEVVADPYRIFFELDIVGGVI